METSTRRSFTKMLAAIVPAAWLAKVSPAKADSDPIIRSSGPQIGSPFPAARDEKLTITFPREPEPHWTNLIIGMEEWNEHCHGKRLYLDGVDVTKWTREAMLPREYVSALGKVIKIPGHVLRYDTTEDGKGIAQPIVLRQINGVVEIREADGVTVAWSERKGML